MKRGEVWWVEDPGAGRRPHLVVTRDSAIPVLRNVLAVPATTTMRGIPTEVALGLEDGMPKECVLSVDNATLLPKSFFVEPICTLGPDRMASVCQALDYATGCR
ncbi:type II toxin-antitoxin system PemK/MazF family toxin [Gaiella sp.]|uniref:type II toxin-antitoxin system PemK/MazF family toxin n=1 Tax=Gaiella sp. TaxID=2663207 RepID=UPI00326466D6